MADGGSGFLDFGQELVIDLFAGGGGASLGLAKAYREPDIAVNHNAVAIAVHRANHPNTKHFTCDVFEVDPLATTGGRPVGVLWASPDCRHHSKAKGGKPRNKKIRGLAWVVIKWAATCKPRIIHLENVEEFADWGPLLDDGSPCKIRKGMTFRRWKKQLENLGYVVEHRELIAADYDTPTIRKRLYVIARCDGEAIQWPAATHDRTGAGGLPVWRAAYECIDFDIAAKSIFDRKKPLASNTQRRVAKGLWRYVLNCADPFIVPLRGTTASHVPSHATSDPLTTITGGGTHHALVQPKLTPFLTEHANSSTQRTFSVTDPLRTQCAQVKGGHFAVVSPTLVQTGYGERAGQQPRALDMSKPLGTVVAGGVKHAVTAAHLAKFRFDSAGSDLHAPMHTVTAGGDMARPAGAAHALGIVAAHMTHLTHHGERAGNSAGEPLRTVTGAHRGEPAVVSAFFEQANGGFYDGDGRDARAPVSTICQSGANQRLVSAYLVKYYRDGGQWQGLAEPMHTVPTKDRMGLVAVAQVPADLLDPELRVRAKQCADLLHQYLPEHFPEPAEMVLVGDYVLVDITLRMLVPRELARAQGFPDDYIIERGLFEDPATGALFWKPITKTDQVRLIGNSVCWRVARALVAANTASLRDLYRKQAAA